MAWTDHPYDAEGYLYLLQPAVVLKARVNLAEATYPVAEIPFDGVTEGSIDDVEMGQTVLIGSVEGASDRGRIYVRGDADHAVGASGLLNIGYCSRGRVAGQVNLIDDSYITVLDTFEVWKRASRFVDETGILKDYELGGIDPLPIAHVGGMGGLASMGFVSGGALTLSFDSSGSAATAPGAALAATEWDVKDGSITVGSDTSAAITATFPAGKRWIRLVKQQTDATLSLPRRHLVVALADADDTLLTAHRARWRLTAEGVSFSCDVREVLSPALYPPGTVAIWLVPERYNGAAGSITGFEVKFAGYVESLRAFGQGRREGWERGSTLSAVDVAGRLDGVRALDSAVGRAASPANSNQLAGANLDRYAWWMLSWHTSAPMLADVHLSGEDHPFTHFAARGGSFYRAVDGICKGGAKRLTMDSRGRLLVRDDPLLLDEADRTSTVLQSLTPADIARIDRAAKPYPAVGVMRATAALESTADADSFDEENPPPPEIHGVAPGEVEGQGPGSAQNSEPWLVPTAEALYARLGHALERMNPGEEYLKIRLAHGGDGGLEPALMAWVEVTTDSDTLGWTDAPLDHERCLLIATEFEFDDEAQTMRQTITVERESFGTPGVYDDVAGPDTRLPTYDPVPPYDGTDLVPVELIVFDSGDAHCHIALWADAETGTPVWEDRSTGLTGYTIWASANTYNYGEYYALQSTGLFFNPDPFGGSAWTLVATPTEIYGFADGLGNDLILSINRRDWMAISCGWGVVCTSTDGGATWVQSVPNGGTVADNYGTTLDDNNCKIAVSPFNNPDAVGEGRLFVGTVDDTNSVFASDDWGINWALVANPDIPNAAPHPHIPYQKDTLVDNVNADQQVYITGWGGGNTGRVNRTEDSGADGFIHRYAIIGANSHAPASALAGRPMTTFTYDGGKYAVAFSHTGAGGGSGFLIIEDDVLIFDSGLLIANSTADNNKGWVNGYPVHQSAWLYGHRDLTDLYATLDDGATALIAIPLPSGYTGASYGEWSIRTLVPPPVGDA